MDALIQLIQNEAKQLDYSWFEQKRSSFESEPFYCAKTGNIIGSVWDGKREKGYNVSLNEYCWFAYYPDRAIDHFEEAEIIDAESVMGKITDILATYLQKFTKNEAKHKLIEKSKDAVCAILTKDIDAGTGDSDYGGLVYDIIAKWKRLLYHEFGYIKEEVELLRTPDVKLEFNIPKEQIAALLYLLNKAGIFNTKSERDTIPVEFAQKYFYYKKGSEYVLCKGITRKYQDIINDDSPSIGILKRKLAPFFK